MRAAFALFPFLLLLQGQQHKTVWSGVYSEQQAAHGAKVYGLNCRSCHKETLTGADSVLKGDTFIQNWREDNLWSFFSLMRSTMPRTTPGSLTDGEYVDIIAYILQQNGFPSGQAELKVAALRSIRMEEKDGPKPLPDRTQVYAIGCLEKIQSSWTLTNVPDLTRIHTKMMKPITAAELKPVSQAKLGKQTLRLHLQPAAAAVSYTPQEHIGEKVLTKGFLMRYDGVQYLDSFDMRSIADACQ